MRKTTTILGVTFDVVTMNEAVNNAVGFIEGGGQHIICTPNPEIVMEARSDGELMQILMASDMVIPDGVGIVWASKYSKINIKSRVTGYDFTQSLFDRIKDSESTVYFLGGAPGVATAAAKRMMKIYPGLKVIGTRNGYFNASEERKIITEIKALSPDLLLVGLGSPKQEKWIYNNMRLTGARLCVGVGGSFDVMADKVKRAPVIFQKLGLEWFYRLITQPTRIKRIMQLPKFVFAVLKERKNNK